MNWITGAFSLIGGSWLKLGIIAAIVAMLGSSVAYVVHLSNSVATLTANNAVLDSALAAEKELVSKREAELTRQRTTTTNLSRAMNRAIKERDTAEKKVASLLARAVSAATKKDPDGAAREINQMSLFDLRCNEIATGSPLTAEEEAGIALNTSCPDLILSKKKAPTK